MRLLIVIAIVALAAALYIRLAPTDPAKWHKSVNVDGPGDRAELGSFSAARTITAPPATALAAVKQVADATDRTKLIAGSVAEGMMTFQTRSRVLGFPDYTTVAIDGDLLVMYARLRFGNADHGVNQARIQQWLVTLGPLTEPL